MTQDRSEQEPPPRPSPGVPEEGEIPQSLHRLDFFLLAVFCAILFGYSMFSGRPLSLHEARLPQTSREMLYNGDWIVPRSGGRPWLERPPFPHWVEVIISRALGQQCDSVWVVRLPAAMMGCLIVLLVAWMAGRWFGRWVGINSGLVLATMYEFWAYSTLAEDDIFLAGLVTVAMALFVKMQYGSLSWYSGGGLGWGHFKSEISNFKFGISSLKPPPRPPFGVPGEGESTGFFGTRPWPVLAFFLVLGLTNLAKGPLVGAAVVVVTAGVFLLWNRDSRQIRRYVWLWGWLLFLAITIAWPAAVMSLRDAKENWKYDYAGGTTEFDQPFWYYPWALLGAAAPWTPAAFIGLWMTARRAPQSTGSPERFLWCWAILPLLVLSIPHRKHHHYLVPSLAPWAILAAIGLREIARSMFSGPLWSRRPRFGLMVFGLPGALAILLLRSKIPGPPLMTWMLAVAWLGLVGAFYLGLRRQSGTIVIGTVVTGLTLGACWGATFLPDQTMQDTIFLHRAEATVQRDALLFIDGDLSLEDKTHHRADGTEHRGQLDFFRIQFYLREDARLLHNLSFLRDEKITAPQVYVIARAADAAKLETLGSAQIILQSLKSRQEYSPADRLTLFRLTFRPDLQRYPAPTDISTMEAMGRKPGPWCGPAL